VLLLHAVAGGIARPGSAAPLTWGMEGRLSHSRTGELGGSSPQEAARLCGRLALEKKGEEVAILDLRQVQIGCDFFVIISGKSETHVRALAEWVSEQVERLLGTRPWHVEGRTHGRWVLLDYVDWVVHIFHGETREYYRLDHLWGDAPVERLAEEGIAAADDGERDA